MQCGMKMGGGAEGLAGLALLASRVPAQSSAHSAAGAEKYSWFYRRNTVYWIVWIWLQNMRRAYAICRVPAQSSAHSAAGSEKNSWFYRFAESCEYGFRIWEGLAAHSPHLQTKPKITKKYSKVANILVANTLVTTSNTKGTPPPPSHPIPKTPIDQKPAEYQQFLLI